MVSMRHNPNTQSVSWSPPAQGLLKCNVDAAFFPQSLSFGCGMCIHDDHGQFMQARTILKQFSPSPHEGEALALLEAIKWLMDLEVENVTIESDCLRVVQGIHHSAEDETEYGSILSNCRLLLVDLPHFNVCFVRRQANGVAHTLAKAAASFAGLHEHYHLPLCIAQQVWNELN